MENSINLKSLAKELVVENITNLVAKHIDTDRIKLVDEKERYVVIYQKG